MCAAQFRRLSLASRPIRGTLKGPPCDFGRELACSVLALQREDKRLALWIYKVIGAQDEAAQMWILIKIAVIWCYEFRNRHL